MPRWNLVPSRVLALAVVVVAVLACGPRSERQVAPAPPRLPGDVVEIPDAHFWMGCVDGDPGCEDDELPAREVWLPAFAIDRLEVTWGEYARCVEAGACTKIAQNLCYIWVPEQGFARDAPFPADLLGTDQPVVCVTWKQADEFCEWRGGRLPLEAEWEYAARGDRRTIFPWGDDPPTCKRARMAGCVDSTRPVGTASEGASPLGVQDLAGNAWEWVADWWARDAYRQRRPKYETPRGPLFGDVKVVRGGSIYDDEADLRVSYRYGLSPEFGYSIVGFRCSR